MKRVLPIIACFSFFPLAGHCCGVCTDQQLAMGAPWVVPVFLVYLGWVVVSFFFHGGQMEAAIREIELFPSPKGAIRLIWITALLMVIIWIISGGSFKAPMLLILAVWLPSIIIRSILFSLKWARNRDLVHLRFRSAFLGFQCFTLLLVGAVIPISLAVARTPASLASKLGYPFEGRSKIIQQLISHGEAAVEPLIAAAQRGLNDPAGYSSPLAPALHCLGIIGGEHAALFLEKVVKDRVRFDTDGPFDSAWQRAACFAYARAAGAGAARDLIAVYEKCTGRQALKERWTILTALIMTGSRDGLQFVGDHMDELLDKTGPGEDRSNALAGAAVAALLTVDRPESFRDLPTVRASGLRGVSDQPSPEEYRDACLARIGKKDDSLRSLWREQGQEARQRLNF